MRQSGTVETATQRLHRLTSYEPGRDWDVPVDDPAVLQDLQVNDLARLPWFFKRYPPGRSRLLLPRQLPSTAAPAVDVLAGTAETARGELDLPHLSRLLYLSAGVVRTMDRPYGTHPFRAAGSAGGRFPLELYVVVPAGSAVPAGRRDAGRCGAAPGCAGAARRVCTGMTRSSMRSSGWGPRPAATRPR